MGLREMTTEGKTALSLNTHCCPFHSDETSAFVSFDQVFYSDSGCVVKFDVMLLLLSSMPSGSNLRTMSKCKKM